MNLQRDLIVQAAVALERMAFVLAEPTEIDPEAALAGATLFAHVALHGTAPGFLMIAADDGFVREVAAGMLGIDPTEVSLAEHGSATVLELANVLGGHAIHEGDGDDSPLAIGLPEVTSRGHCIELVRRARADGFCGVIAAESGKLVLAGIMKGQRS